jgi:hypothetical protein
MNKEELREHIREKLTKIINKNKNINFICIKCNNNKKINQFVDDCLKRRNINSCKSCR